MHPIHCISGGYRTYKTIKKRIIALYLNYINIYRCIGHKNEMRLTRAHARSPMQMYGCICGRTHTPDTHVCTHILLIIKNPLNFILFCNMKLK